MSYIVQWIVLAYSTSQCYIYIVCISHRCVSAYSASQCHIVQWIVSAYTAGLLVPMLYYVCRWLQPMMQYILSISCISLQCWSVAINQGLLKPQQRGVIKLL